ncbi:MAG: glycosyltransferase [Bacteroidales bacterium]|nr:glycosyltransferase [Bacteroidales bacterium]
MNLLIVPSWYPSKGKPGNGIFFKEQAIALSKAGYQVTVIDVSFHGREDIFNSKNFQLTYKNDVGVHVYALKIPSFFVLSRFLSIHVFMFKSLLFFIFKKLIKKGCKFDAIHAHSFYPAGYCASKLSEKYNIPLVVTEHSSGILKTTLKTKERQLLEYTVNHCNSFICVSEALKQSLNAQVQTKKEIIVVPNLFSSDFSYHDIERNEDEFVFLSVGNLNNGKRHAFTISCFKDAFKINPKIKLRIAGNGELEATLKKQIVENNLTENVQLLGHLNREQLKIELNNCNAFVLASAFETFGIVYIEAMASGKPVIATRNGGANDIVNKTNGVLVDVDNSEQLIKAFQYMYENVAKFDHKQIAIDCYVKYSQEAVVKQLSKVYEDVKHA